MADNTELALVESQTNNITREIATLKYDTELAVQENRKSYEACVKAGESLLYDIEVSGMNDSLDSQAADFIKKAKLTEKAMNEKRKGVTQVFDLVRKGFTAMENLISVKNENSVVARIQKKRDEYAAYKLEQQRKAEAERQRQERIKEAKIQLKTNSIDILNNLLTEHSANAINKLNDTFSLLTLDNKDEVKRRISEFSDVIDLGGLFVNNVPSYSSEVPENEAREIMNEAFREVSGSLIASYKNTVCSTRDELLMKFDSKIAELTELKRIDEELKRKAQEAAEAARKAREAAEAAKAAKAEEERKKREEEVRLADEAAKDEQQRKLAEEQEKRDAENAAQHATAQAQSLFNQTETSSGAKTKVKVTKRLVIADTKGWLEIIQQWWTIEGSSLPADKLASKLEFMRKACEKHANKEDELIVSPYIKYEDEVTAK